MVESASLVAGVEMIEVMALASSVEAVESLVAANPRPAAWRVGSDSVSCARHRAGRGKDIAELSLAIRRLPNDAVMAARLLACSIERAAAAGASARAGRW